MLAAREPWVRRLVVAAVCCLITVVVVGIASTASYSSATDGSALSSWGGRSFVLPDGSGAAASKVVDARDLMAMSAHDASDYLDAFFAEGGQVFGFIFFGRRRYTSVQWPYLVQARRAGSSGVLSKVVYVANTDDRADLEWLAALQGNHSDFVEVQHPERVVRQNANNADYCTLYKEAAAASGKKTLIIKIDDDLVYIAPDALRNLVAAKLRSDYLFVSANVVNHPLLAHVHQRLGLYDYDAVAEMKEAEQRLNHTDVLQLPDSWLFGYSTFSSDGWRGARTPHAHVQRADFCARRRQSGAHAMLQHLLLLHRLHTLGEAGATALYDAFRVWDFDAQGYNTGRWSINCFVYDPADLAALDVNECRAVDDEHYLTNVFPAHMGRHCAATGDALVAHFAYYPQREWLEANSAVLARYEVLSHQLAQRMASERGVMP